MVAGDDPVWVKFECKEVDPSENSRAVNISHYNSRTVTDSEESSTKANRKSTTGHQPRSCITPNFPKIRFRIRYSKLAFLALISTKTLNVYYKVSLSKNSQRQCCSAINYRSNGINILQGMTPFPQNLGLKAPAPNRKDGRFTFHTRSAVQSALQTFLFDKLWHIFS